MSTKANKLVEASGKSSAPKPVPHSSKVSADVDHMKFQARGDLDTLKRAHEIQSDKDRMKMVKHVAKEEAKIHEKILKRKK